ncbi:MAG TPA: HAD-IIB family hydrolase [Vicinamibacterales bacterium]|nr:HAD-IIB family hydrolase [Vicinamibacterales bacterium]
MTPRQIASDLDGTLIPPGPHAAHDDALAVMADAAARGRIELAYITGRHLSLALEGITTAGLPLPARLFCDVGTSLHHRVGDEYVQDEAFRAAMRDAFGATAPGELRERLRSIADLEPQADDRQAEFKLSFVVRAGPLEPVVASVRTCLGAEAAQVTMVSSHDPLTGVGLVDILPRASGKRRALDWLTGSLALGQGDVLFAGDSGNDRDALLSGHPAVLVGNAPEALRADLTAAAREAGLAERLYCAEGPFAVGVVEGARFFKFI